MAENLNDKVVLVTGSTGSIGEATVCRFSSLGSKVVVTGRNESKVNRVAERCTELSPFKYKPLTVICDLTKENDVENLMKQTIEKFGKLDVLVNCAAHDSTGSILDDNILTDLNMQISVKLRSSMQLSRLALPHLIESKGCVVNVSGIPKPHSPYLNLCMVYSMLDMFTKVLALEFGPKGVRVNSVNPGFVDTESSRRVDSTGEGKTWFESVCPLRRIANVDEIVNTIVFFTSEYSSFITGFNLNVDGGFMLI